MAKSESKALIEAYAKQTGKPAEEIAAEIATLFGYQKSGMPLPSSDEKISPTMKAILEAQKIEREMGSTGKGEVSPVVKMMMETVTMMPLMKMMGSMGQEGKSSNDLLAKNDEKWERRLAQDKADRKEEALQARLDELKNKIELIAAAGTKKDDPVLANVLAEVKETKATLESEKAQRQKDLLNSKDAEFRQYKKDMTARLDAIENREPPKTTDEIILEEGERLQKYEDLMTRYGKAHGWSRAKIAQGIEEGKTVMQQLLTDLVGKEGILAKYVDVIGKQKSEAEEPQIAPPETQIVCKDCGGVSDNGTDYCSSCNQAYAIEQQKAQAEAEARKKGEIPAETEQPAPTTEEVLNS